MSACHAWARGRTHPVGLEALQFDDAAVENGSVVVGNSNEALVARGHGLVELRVEVALELVQQVGHCLCARADFLDAHCLFLQGLGQSSFNRLLPAAQLESHFGKRGLVLDAHRVPNLVQRGELGFGGGFYARSLLVQALVSAAQPRQLAEQKRRLGSGHRVVLRNVQARADDFNVLLFGEKG